MAREAYLVLDRNEKSIYLGYDGAEARKKARDGKALLRHYEIADGVTAQNGNPLATITEIDYSALQPEEARFEVHSSDMSILSMLLFKK